MRKLLSFVAIAMIVSSAARADAIGDANAAESALSQGNYDEAARLLSQAIQSGTMSASDSESAYVERARAYLGNNNFRAALPDLAAAQKLNSNDADIDKLRAQASSLRIQAETSLWNLIPAGDEDAVAVASSLKNYLQLFPDGQFALLAHNRLAQLKTEQDQQLASLNQEIATLKGQYEKVADYANASCGSDAGTFLVNFVTLQVARLITNPIDNACRAKKEDATRIQSNIEEDQTKIDSLNRSLATLSP